MVRDLSRVARELGADGEALPGHAAVSGLRLLADESSAGSDGEN
jgi:hypothetical protein